MGKGYWIARVEVHDGEAYQAYVAAAAPVFAAHQARFLVRGGEFTAVEGGARSRNVVIEFPTYATALACYRSPEYQQAWALRAPVSDAEIVVIEGYDGPQP